MKRSWAVVVLIVFLAGICPATGRLAAAEIEPRNPALSETAVTIIEPLAFFEQLVQRYRRLAFYSDRVRLSQTFAREGETPRRLDTEFACAVDQEGLRVQTPGRQAAAAVGLSPSIRTTPMMRRMKQRYDLWLAPHLMLRFAREPLQEFRDGVREGFTPTDAESVTVDEQPMVHVKLESGPDPQESQRATFDLYVNPESMLIERIEGQQQLADGTSLLTTLDIEPLAVEDALDPVGPPVPSVGPSVGPSSPVAPEAPMPVLDRAPVPVPVVPAGPVEPAAPESFSG